MEHVQCNGLPFQRQFDEVMQRINFGVHILVAVLAVALLRRGVDALGYSAQQDVALARQEDALVVGIRIRRVGTVEMRAEDHLNYLHSCNPSSLLDMLRILFLSYAHRL